jgi:hypothetical protein
VLSMLWARSRHLALSSGLARSTRFGALGHHRLAPIAWCSLGPWLALSLARLGALVSRGSLMDIGAIQRAGSLVLDGTLCASGSLYADGALGYIGSLGQHGALLTLGSLARAGALAELGSLHRYGALCPRLAHTAWCSLLFSLAQPFDKLVKISSSFAIITGVAAVVAFSAASPHGQGLATEHLRQPRPHEPPTTRIIGRSMCSDMA